MRKVRVWIQKVEKEFEEGWDSWDKNESGWDESGLEWFKVKMG